MEITNLLIILTQNEGELSLIGNSGAEECAFNFVIAR
jgi:hypothetical protein